MSRKYETTLFECFQDTATCAYGTFLPPCLAADTWAQLRNEKVSCCHLICINHPFWNRQMIRSKYGMEVNFVGDCIIYTFCCCCANCQDAREVRRRESMLNPGNYEKG